MSTDKKPIIEMKNISKSFGGVQALKNVDLTLYPGEVLGIVGDNGAGKSTLIKILSGVYQQDEGEIYLKGEKVKINSAIKARDLGIETIYQNLLLVEEFTPAQNIYLAREPVENFRKLDFDKMKQGVAKTLDKIGIDLNMLGKVTKKLSGGQQQAVAISRAIHWDAEIVIMDEPTAALGVDETEKVFNLITQLKEQEVGVIVISHNMRDVFGIVDRIQVLHLGEVAGVKKKEETNEEEIVKLIMGVGKEEKSMSTTH